jgi:hypothetical protein
MMQQIETSLGISHTSGLDVGHDGHDQARLVSSALVSDAISVSLRETLLSQEMLRTASMNGFDALSLNKIMEEVKKLVDGRDFDK